MTLSLRAIESAGLGDIVARRVRGEALTEAELAQARAVDLLVLGAAADAIRRADVGDEVKLHVGAAPAPAPGLVVVGGEAPKGTELLRHVAMTRLAMPGGGRLCVDFAACGLEISQIALAFGASELAGPLATKKGLTLVDSGKALKRRTELAGYVTRAQRTPVFVESR
jgi:hypothetical protein